MVPVTTQRLHDMLVTALGPVGPLLEEARMVDIMCNADGAVWVERLGTPMACTAHTLAATQRERIIRLLASHAQTECHAAQPTLSCVLPETGERFQGFLPPVVAAPAFVIRRPALEVFTLADYVRDGICTARQAAAMDHAVVTRKNLLIAGSTGSGKTTLCNALLARMAQTGHRLVTLEDTAELQCTAPNHLALYAKPGVASMHDLVIQTMRCRPDRIIVGEVRDGAALDLVKAWNTGHPGGLATVHANGAMQALIRLEQLIQEVTVTVPQALIAEAIQVVVYMERTAAGRTVESVQAVCGVTDGVYLMEPLA